MILDTLYAATYGLLTNSGGSCLSILTYHRVLPELDPMRPGEPDPQRFRRQMARLRRFFTPIALPDAVQALKRGERLPQRAVAVTFDDGYADNLTVALPILREFGIPATVFVAAGFLDGGRMWNDTVIEAVRSRSEGAWDLSDIGLGILTVGEDEQKYQLAENMLEAIKHRPSEERMTAVARIAEGGGRLPDDLMLTSEQLRELRTASIHIGAHTVSHPILTSLSAEASRREITESKVALERILSDEVSLFAYPNGKYGRDWNDAHAAMVRDAGYEGAVTTDSGVSSVDTDAYRLPRFIPWDRSDLRYLLRMLQNARR